VVGRAPSVYIRSVTGSNPVHDLSKLRIDRDPPPEVRRAFGRTLAVIIILGLLIAGGLFWLRSRSAASVQTVVATPISSGGGGGASAAGATSVTANGYVVARIRASVSAKIPGRLASLTVDGGSDVRKGQVIARLENADYAAAVGEAEANLASARAQVAEAVADRDQSAREARRVRPQRGPVPRTRGSGRRPPRYATPRRRWRTPTSVRPSRAPCFGKRPRWARWWPHRSAAGSHAERW
jgi:hypothetical protein